MKNENLDMKTKIQKQLKKYGNVQSLMQYINVDTLYQKHRKLDGSKAVGVDRITKREYSKNIYTNLENLVDKMKDKKYYPQMSKRIEIPKPNGKTRPLGIPSYEDKIVQAQIAEILNIIFDRYFKDFSFGFRPNKDCHQAIDKLDKIIMHGKVNWIVEADIKGFFDHVNHDILLRMLEVVIKDRDFIELIRRFLKAGYMYNGEYCDTNEGTPQGGLISPILANLYLHVALDTWFDGAFRELCKGEIYIVRYADDFVCLFQYENDARLFYKMLVNRFAQFDLEIEPTKTKIFPFGRYTKEDNKFDFLGFTISNGKSRNGYYMVNYKTSEKKSKMKFQKISEYIKENRHLKPKELIKGINRILIGMYNYYGISGNFRWLSKLYYFAILEVKKWLSRRSQRGKLTWEKYSRIIKYNPIAEPKIAYNLWGV